MAETTPVFAYGAAALLGVISHVAYFNRSEHHLHAIRYMQLFALTYLATVFVLARTAESSPSPTAAAFRTATSLASSYLAGLYASLLTYRLTPLHPLHAFPGPFLARLTSFYLPLHVLHRPPTTTGATKRSIPQAYRTLAALHARHGPIVRVGARELSVADPAAVPLVYGPGSACAKAPWYDNDAPLTSMHTSRDRAHHDARRRVWARAFAERAVRGYEGRVEGLVGVLVGRLRGEGNEGDEGVDARSLFAWFAYDVMGALAFGREDGFGLPTWAFRSLAAIPGLAAGYWKFIGYCSDQLDERMKTKPEHPDIMSSLIEPVKDRELSDRELKMLQADSRLIIVAGSDTTSSTLTHIFYHLAASPEHQAKLLAELRPHMSSSSPDAAATADPTFPPRILQDLPHLNGLISETLRLHPPVPSALQRLTPPTTGLTLPNGTHIPPDTVVWCPSFVIGRSAAAYVEPEAFVPERWYDGEKKGWVRQEKAFAPFSMGAYACIGRPLALMELRCVVARVVAVFEVAVGV
ncbi:hypothetical protein SLS58_001741 [Diplodia intermedia]|uniref:Cytochrome P450 n=1 Tax=Diplodia intermedia TaxID=856260 RepID=A0ABR3U0U4_9PEZI